MSFLRSAAAYAVFQYNSSGVNEYSTFYKLFITKFQKIASMLRICNFKSFKKETLIIQKQDEILNHFFTTAESKKIQLGKYRTLV